jgi:hypothetical protein
MENKQVEMKTGANDWASNIRQMRLGVATGSGFGEQYFGDPSTSNLAIGEKMELPLLKQIETWQKLWSDIYFNILAYGVGLGNSEGTEETKNEQLELDIDFPPIVVQDVLKLNQALATAKANNYIDDVDGRLLTLTGFGINNIDESMERMEEADKENAAKAEAIAGQGTPKTPEELAAEKKDADEKAKAEKDTQDKMDADEKDVSFIFVSIRL